MRVNCTLIRSMGAAAGSDDPIPCRIDVAGLCRVGGDRLLVEAVRSVSGYLYRRSPRVSEAGVGRLRNDDRVVGIENVEAEGDRIQIPVWRERHPRIRSTIVDP